MTEKICSKCGEVMEKMVDRFGKSWFCYNCGRGIIVPHKLRSRIWSLLYSLKYFFTDFRKAIFEIRQALVERSTKK